MKLPVTLFFNPTRQPNIFARSPTIAVNNPIIPRDTKKHGHPPNIPAGGINANMIYQIVNYKVVYYFFKSCIIILLVKDHISAINLP